MFQNFVIYLLIFCPNSDLSFADKEDYENSSLNGKEMSIMILRHDRLPWYAKKDGNLLRMFNRGCQISRIMKKDGQLFRIYQRDGQLSRNYRMDGQFKISEQIPKSQSMCQSKVLEQKRPWLTNFI
jgi:hypothetical protein